MALTPRGFGNVPKGVLQATTQPLTGAVTPKKVPSMGQAKPFSNTATGPTRSTKKGKKTGFFTGGKHPVSGEPL